MDWVLGRAVIGDDRMTRLMIGRQVLFLVGDDMAAFFRAHDHLNRRFLDLGHGNGMQVLARGQEGRFVEEVFQIRAGKAGRRFRDDRQLHIGSERLAAGHGP